MDLTLQAVILCASSKEDAPAFAVCVLVAATLELLKANQTILKGLTYQRGEKALKMLHVLTC